MFGVTQEKGESVTLAPSQKLFTDELVRVERDIVQLETNKADKIDLDQLEVKIADIEGLIETEIPSGIRVIQNKKMWDTETLTDAPRTLMCIPLHDRRYVKLTLKNPKLTTASNERDYIVYGVDGAILKGTYDTNEYITISLPEGAMSIGCAYTQNATPDLAEFKLSYVVSKEESANTSVSSQTNNYVVPNMPGYYYDILIDSYSNVYNNLDSFRIELDNISKISIPLFPVELYSTLGIDADALRKAGNFVFKDANDNTINYGRIPFCQIGERLVIQRPQSAVYIVVSYFRDSYCEQNGYPTLQEIGGISVFSEVDIKEIDEKILILQASTTLIDERKNIIDNYYTNDLINNKYFNTDVCKIDNSRARYPYPALISAGQYNTQFWLKISAYMSELTDNNIDYIEYECFANSASSTYSVSVNYIDGSASLQYRVPIIEGYNIIKLSLRSATYPTGKRISHVVLPTTSPTDTIGKVFIGKKDNVEGVLGSNNIYNDNIRDKTKELKKSFENNSLFSNLISLEAITRNANRDDLNDIENPIILTGTLNRYDSKKYAAVVKTKGTKATQWVFNFPDNAVTLLPDATSGGEDETIYYRYVDSYIEDEQTVTINIVLFTIEEDYLKSIRFQQQITGFTYSVLDVYVIPVTDDIQKPFEVYQIFQNSGFDMYNLSKVSLESGYSQTSGVYRKKKLVALGDSIASQATYLPTIIKHTSMRLYKKVAAGGAHVRVTGDDNCIYFFADNVPEDTDVILIIAGQNDIGLAITDPRFGSVSDEPYLSDVNEAGPTFCACYKGMLIKLLKKMPKAKIIACGLVPTWTLTAAGMEAYTKRKLEFSDRIKEMCDLYGIQYVDLLRKSGINWYNAPYMFNHDGDGEDGGPSSDDDGQVHPSPTGGERCGNVILSEII